MRIHTRLIRGLRALGLAAAISFVAGCGGGGGGGSTSSNASPAPTPTPVANAVAVTVSSGPNIPMVSVTICAPGSTTNCQTINNIQVDTGSFGLRILNTEVSQVLNSLPVSTVSGSQLAECSGFADGFTWGTVRTANVVMAGETGSSVPIQIIGDLSSSSVPAACQQAYGQQLGATNLGANGILGIGAAPTDAAIGDYFSCSNGANCQAVSSISTAQAVANPVTKFATDNNGVIIEMPAVPSTGQPSAQGTLYFGIGTQSNNTFGGSVKIQTGPYGDFVGTLNGVSAQYDAFLDTGSNAFFFNDANNASLTQCTNYPGFYCPTTTQIVTGSVQNYGGTGAVTAISFNVANASTLFAGNNWAFDNVGGPAPATLTAPLDLGLPYFYGRNVYVGFDRTASGGSAPYVAY